MLEVGSWMLVEPFRAKSRKQSAEGKLDIGYLNAINTINFQTSKKMQTERLLPAQIR